MQCDRARARAWRWALCLHRPRASVAVARGDHQAQGDVLEDARPLLAGAGLHDKEPAHHGDLAMGHRVVQTPGARVGSPARRLVYFVNDSPFTKYTAAEQHLKARGYGNHVRLEAEAVQRRRPHHRPPVSADLAMGRRVITCPPPSARERNHCQLCYDREYILERLPMAVGA